MMRYKALMSKDLWCCTKLLLFVTKWPSVAPTQQIQSVVATGPKPFGVGQVEMASWLELSQLAILGRKRLM
jgi:hypothetical protein